MQSREQYVRTYVLVVALNKGNKIEAIQNLSYRSNNLAERLDRGRCATNLIII